MRAGYENGKRVGAFMSLKGNMLRLGAASMATAYALHVAIAHGQETGEGGHGGSVTVWSLVLEAGLVVQAVMALLVFMSIMSWTIFLGKWGSTGATSGGLDRMRRRVAEASSRDALTKLAGSSSGRGGAVLKAAMGELESGPDDRAVARAYAAAGQARTGEVEDLQGGMGWLATTGATAPFIGLFGTVWGIMNSFIGIAETQTTNLAVVAPGIAEALIATGIGLFAAIPAVVFYNILGRRIRSIARKLDDVSGSFVRGYERLPDAAEG